MATKQQESQQADEKKQDGQQLCATIAKRVLHTLGQPSDLHQVQVRKLWDDHFRVNVFVGPDAASAKVSHSFFLRADGDGNILVSTPEITKRH